MREWVTVLCVGGGAGGLAAVFALWLRYERSPLGGDQRLHAIGYWIFSFLINTFAGATAGFFLWATYTGANMSSTDAPPGVLAASLAVGIGGVSAVQRFLYVAENLRESADESAASVENVIEASLIPGVPVDPASDPAHTGGGGATS